MLTGCHLTGSKLEDIMEYLDFDLVHSRYRNVPLAVQYIESWICQYEMTEYNVAPTWSKFFDALQHTKLDQIKKRIEDCLLKTHAITQPEGT